MKEKVSTSSALRVWWSITWQTTVIGFFVGYMGGMLGVGVAIGAGLSGDIPNQVASVVSYVSVMVVSYFVIKGCIGQSFGNYRLVLVKDEQSKVLEASERT